MKIQHYMLVICLLLSSFSLLAQDRTEVQPMAENYVDLLLQRDFQKAARLLHLEMSYVMKWDEWVTAQESTVNEDMSMRTSALSMDKAAVTEKEINGLLYFLYEVPEELDIRIENDQLGDMNELMSEIIVGFQEQYGKDKVFKLSDRSLRIERQHQFLIVATAGATPVWRIFDFPNGRLDLAYGLLPAGVWNAFFPEQSLPATLPYQLAVKQSVGYYFQLLKAKQYEQAKDKTVAQKEAPGPFMAWYKDIDTEENELFFYNYLLSTPVKEARLGDQRYAGFSLKWTLTLSTPDDASNDEIRVLEEKLKQSYPASEVSYEEMTGIFSWHTYTPVLAVADPGQNNWKLLIDDPNNGMSIKQNISTEIIRAVGLD